MLNITRRRGQRIVLGDNIFVSVLEVSGQTVRLGIEAPQAVRVYREELWLEVKRENEAAALVAASGQMPELPSGLPGTGNTGSAGRATINRTAPRA
jgi:carbon storage regulator